MFNQRTPRPGFRASSSQPPSVRSYFVLSHVRNSQNTLLTCVGDKIFVFVIYLIRNREHILNMDFDTSFIFLLEGMLFLKNNENSLECKL